MQLWRVSQISEHACIKFRSASSAHRFIGLQFWHLLIPHNLPENHASITFYFGSLRTLSNMRPDYIEVQKAITDPACRAGHSPAPKWLRREMQRSEPRAAKTSFVSIKAHLRHESIVKPGDEHHFIPGICRRPCKPNCDVFKMPEA